LEIAIHHPFEVHPQLWPKQSCKTGVSLKLN
jgi:hypothetical protein